MHERVFMGQGQARKHAIDIVREVAELPDRTSPEDQPEMMLVSHKELEKLIIHELLR